MKSSLEEYLNSKTLYYDKIDFNIIKDSWNIIKAKIEIPYVIHIVGTNGKGSTGRFLASFFNQLSKNVLHYSSPHIVKFNERIWINGIDSTNKQLDLAHCKLQKLLTKKLLDQLTYFEYTTLISLILSDGLDYLVLEAGLGGEFDATNVVKNNLTLLTTIGLDHQNFLGDTIKEITLTKVRSCNKSIIIGKQFDINVIDYVKDLFLDTRELLEMKRFDATRYKDLLPGYLINNLQLAFTVLDYLDLPIIDYKLPELFGRYQKIDSNIRIDVGHNPLAAKVISQQLQKENKKVNLVYNSYEDKDYNTVIDILKDYIKKVYIIKCDDIRIVDIKILKSTLKLQNIEYEEFIYENINQDEDYLVFGSFLVVEEFLKGYKYVN